MSVARETRSVKTDASEITPKGQRVPRVTTLGKATGERGYVRFCLAPDAVLAATDISFAAKALLIVVMKLAADGRSTCWAGNAALAERLGVSERYIQVLTRELLGAGYLVTVDKGDGKRHLTPAFATDEMGEQLFPNELVGTNSCSPTHERSCAPPRTVVPRATNSCSPNKSITREIEETPEETAAWEEFLSTMGGEDPDAAADTGATPAPTVQAPPAGTLAETPSATMPPGWNAKLPPDEAARRIREMLAAMPIGRRAPRPMPGDSRPKNRPVDVSAAAQRVADETRSRQLAALASLRKTG